MKIRQGFVSNSSSSSFVIPVDKGTPLDEKAFHKQIWGTDEELYFYNPYGDGYVTSTAAIENVIAQIKEDNIHTEYYSSGGKINTPDDLAKVITNFGYDNYFDKYPSMPVPYDKMNAKELAEYRNEIEKYYEKENQIRIQEATRLINEVYPDKDLYVVEFHDDNQFGSILEHGDAFNRPGILRNSNH